MTIQLRQICLVANELGPAIRDLTEILGINVCHHDPGVAKYGLENALLPIGNNFLEVVAPVVENTAAHRYLQRRGGDGGYMVITQVDCRDIQAAIRRRALDRGVRVAHEEERDGWNFCQLHPGDMVAAFLDIEWDQRQDLAGCWQPAGGTSWADKVKRDVTAELIGAELQCDEPAGLAELWGSILGSDVQHQDDTLSIELNNANLRFVSCMDGRGAGLGGIDITVSDRQRIIEAAKSRNSYVTDNQIVVCGTRFYLTDTA